MRWRRLLIIAATVVALVIVVNLSLLTKSIAFVVEIFDQDFAKKNYFMLQAHSQDETYYPFKWQGVQREKLEPLLQRPDQMPTATDEISNALFFEYSWRHGNESVYQEGIRREPNNALYHYLLGNLYLHQGVREEQTTKDENTGKMQWEYKIKDREKLDLGMQEVKTGSKMLLKTHCNALIRTRFDAMPPAHDLPSRMMELAIPFSEVHPEFSEMRNIGRVNSFYLSLLLSEGRLAEAEPYVHTGEYLVVQAANDESFNLSGQITALGIGNLSKLNDAAVCRQFGLNREAETIEANQNILIGKLQEWKNYVNKERAAEIDKIVFDHAGWLPSLVLPVHLNEPKGMLSKDLLRPSRLIDYLLVEKLWAAVLCLLSCMMLVYAGLKYWRWKLITHNDSQPAPGVELSSRDLLRIIALGLLVPCVLYLLYIAIPAISRRDHTFGRTIIFFAIGIGIFTLWTQIVPTMMAAGILRQHSIAGGLITDEHPWRTRFGQLLAAFFSFIWSTASIPFLALPLSWVILYFLLVNSPIRDLVITVSSTQWKSIVSSGPISFSGIGYPASVAVIMLVGLLLLAIPFIPALFERKNLEFAPFHLAMSRSMITVYAVMTLFYASFYPICAAFERHYTNIDQVVSVYRQGDDIGVTNVEGKIKVMLREGVREGATKLGIAWK